MKKILGIGNALVDLMTQINDDSLLSELKLPKGSMQLVDKNVSRNIIEKTKNFKRTITSGGSAANTIHGLSSLGIKTGFIGKVGKDEMGKYFKDDMEKNKIKTYLLESSSDSGVAVALVSPDGERTFAVHLGAAVELIAEDIKTEFFKGYDLLHIEGYLLQNYSLIETACGLAKKNGLKVSLDLASFNVVEAHRDFLEYISKEYADIIFANEDEAKAMTGHHPEEALNHIAQWCDVAVVKTGKKGSLVKTNGEIFKIDSINTNVVDTTGAGDLYAAGFLFGLLNEISINECGRIGSLLGKHVIEQIGAKIPDDVWGEIKKMI
ncbi:MAG TPA: adenosine kinase [Bacteroidales bacterium]|nr:adenosine kinase [Bacteroidales bacterium]HPS18401.1 adenosine kinase [Bacteroidales bacterium]